MRNDKYDSLIRSWNSTYEKTINRMNDFIEQIKNSQPEGLSIVSPKNLGVFKQLMDLDVYFAEYMKYADACIFTMTELIINISNISEDIYLRNVIIDQIKPKIEEMSNLFLKASKNFHDQKLKFNVDVFESIEK